MKISCECGATIHSGFVDKGFITRDRDWDPFWEQIDDAIENPEETADQRERACMNLRTGFKHMIVYQCIACARLYISDKNGELHAFASATPERSARLFL